MNTREQLKMIEIVQPKLNQVSQYKIFKILNRYGYKASISGHNMLFNIGKMPPHVIDTIYKSIFIDAYQEGDAIELLLKCNRIIPV
jgi:hypothetical protein